MHAAGGPHSILNIRPQVKQRLPREQASNDRTPRSNSAAVASPPAAAHEISGTSPARTKVNSKLARLHRPSASAPSRRRFNVVRMLSYEVAKVSIARHDVACAFVSILRGNCTPISRCASGCRLYIGICDSGLPLTRLQAPCVGTQIPSLIIPDLPQALSQPGILQRRKTTFHDV